MRDDFPSPRVFTYLVQTGRAETDNLPAAATGAAMMCYAPGCDQESTGKEVFASLQNAGYAVTEVAGFGALEERLAAGHPISDEERLLMEEALAHDKLVIAQKKPLFAV